MIEVVALVEALRDRAHGTPDYGMHCLRAAHLLGLSVAPIITGLNLLVRVGGIVSSLVLVDACSAFCSSGLGFNLPVVAGRFASGQHLARTIGYAHTVGPGVADELDMADECPVLQPLSNSMLLLFSQSLTL